MDIFKLVDPNLYLQVGMAAFGGLFVVVTFGNYLMRGINGRRNGIDDVELRESGWGSKKRVKLRSAKKRAGRHQVVAHSKDWGDDDGEDGDDVDVDDDDGAHESALVHGLYNMGNTCFFNSVIQSLASLDTLYIFLSRQCEGEHGNPLPLVPRKQEITFELFRTLQVLRMAVDHRAAFSPTSLISALNRSKRLLNMDQQDAQELFQLVSSALTKEYLQSAIATSHCIPSLRHALLPPPVPGDGHSDVAAYAHEGIFALREVARAVSEAPAASPFNGLLASRLSCVVCGYSSGVRLFEFDNLTLNLPLRSRVSLDDVFRTFVSLEHISDACCRRCSLRQTYKTLLLHLEQMQSQARKQSVALKELQMKSKKQQNAASKVKRRAKKHHGGARAALSGQNDPRNRTTSDMVDANNRSAHRTRAAKEAVRETCLRAEQAMVDVQIVKHALDESDEDRPLPSHIAPVRVQTPHTKQMMIARAPRILALYFVRSAVMGMRLVKNSCLVMFPERLDISPYCLGPSIEMRPTLSMRPIKETAPPQILSLRPLCGNPRILYSPLMRFKLPYESGHVPSKAPDHFIDFKEDCGSNDDLKGLRVEEGQASSQRAQNQLGGVSRVQASPSPMKPPTPPPSASPSPELRASRLAEGSSSEWLPSMALLPTPTPSNQATMTSTSNAPLTNIIFPKGMDQSAFQPRSTQFRLQSVVMHEGRHDFGHYIAYRRAPARTPSKYSNRWFRISDDCVSGASVEEVLRRGDGAVMLFYEQVQAKTAQP